MRRKEIGNEADFFGSMDGASKFVRGDATAAVIITVINLIGGIVVGVMQNGLSFSDAAHTYSLLTVGDGIAAQIPALLISVATGIIVTRSASDTDLGSDLTTQILRQYKAPMVAGGVICAFALVPGLPKLPFLLIGACFLAIGWTVRNGMPTDEAVVPATVGADDKPALPVSKDAVLGGAPARRTRTGDRLRARAARGQALGRQPRAARVGDPPPDRRRAGHGHPRGAHPRRDRPGLPRVRRQGAWIGGHARAPDGRPPARDGPGRRDRPGRRPAHDRARVRPARHLDRRQPAGRGGGARLHRRRWGVGDRHAPHRADPRTRRRAADAPGRAPAARPAQAVQRRRR